MENSVKNNHLKVSPHLLEMAKLFQKAGFCFYIVGGWVRDSIRGFVPEDYDVATDARPWQVMELFRRVIPTGIKHGTVTVLFKGERVEVTTFRIEGKYSDSRRPDTIEYTDDLTEDLTRRDFTINAIAYDPLAKKLYDPAGGIEDIRRKIIRAIGNPVERFREDGLRTIRACRFSSQLDFRLDSGTLQAIGESLNTLKGVSNERIYAEFCKIFESVKPSLALRLFDQSGILETLFFTTEKKVYRERLLCNLLFCDNIPLGDIPLRFAALFYNLEDEREKSAQKAFAFFKRYRVPNAIIKKTLHFIQCSRFFYTEEWSAKSIRHFIAEVGEEEASSFINWYRAFVLADPEPERLAIFLNFKKLCQKELASGGVYSLKKLVVTGNTLIDEARIPPGPLLGKVMEQLLQRVLDNPTYNSREMLLTIAGEEYGKLAQG